MFQVSIHPGATIGTGVLVDHGTGVVIGETAIVGDDVSMLHKVTLSGSGANHAVRHPRIENNAILGAGSTIIGPVTVGEGASVGACSMVTEDIPAYSVAVGVPAKIISHKRTETSVPSSQSSCVS
jgi:serine O-acetyltransferase